MFDPIKNKPIGAAEVQEKFGVGPEKVVDVQALCGDSVDNVPGVPGIGVKTAAELINTYGDLETLLEHAPEIKQPKRRQIADRFRRAGAHVEEAGQLDDHVPLTGAARRSRGEAARSRQAHAFPARAGLPHAAQPRRRKLGNAAPAKAEAPAPAASQRRRRSGRAGITADPDHRRRSRSATS